jgi:immune inhibitor A
LTPPGAQAEAPASRPPDSTDLPRADPFSLAARLLHIQAPRTVNDSPPHYDVGQRATFWLEDPAGSRAAMVNAVLRYAGEHCWIYLQERAQTADAAIARAGEDFDTLVYPTVTADVGTPAFPGIDGDTRTTILLADLHGAGGYFNEIDDRPASIERISNQRKMIYLDLGSSTPGTVAFAGYMAHEFQHLAHFGRNPAAQAWINEGMSELVREQITHTLLNIPSYEDHSDTQLNDWPTLEEGSANAQYGAAHSFLRYLLQHYGGIAQAGTLAAKPGDGIAEVRAYLSEGGYGVSFEDVFEDWLAANLIDDPSGGRFSQNDASVGVHQITPLAVPSDLDTGVHQFGAQYYSIAPGPRGVTLDVQGASTVAPLPTAPPAGSIAWWSRRGDSLDTTLTRPVDLTGVESATLEFATWHEIESDYDFGYIEVSTDGGVNWTAIRTQHTSAGNPFAIALGPAFSGESGGTAPAWIDEQADLSAFAGRRILLRFEYVTDSSANRDGWAIADVRIPAIGFADRAGDRGWTAEGFTRLGEPLPQRFLVEAVLPGSPADVRRLTLDQNNHATLEIPANSGRTVLIVSGATDLIRTTASFHIAVRAAGT